MARQEHSAGVVVYHQDLHAPKRHYLLLDYGRHWDFPKGHLETGESVTTAALRELREETGIGNAGLIPGFEREIEYFFRDRRKGLIHKKVWFGLAKTPTVQVRLSEEHVGYAFLPFEAASQRLTFANAKSVLREANDYLNTLTASTDDKLA